ncbi:response regulator transcription factor [Ramlibacter sp.]|uniref:response regulator transcription factor n=1 Tax=Ramlibacter sp. TaxID=1917967 RepID=UPI003D0DFAD8
MGGQENRRVLVVDDEPSMHEDFRSVLASPAMAAADAQFDQLEARVFSAASRRERRGFDIRSAHQGREGLDLARGAALEGMPFAVAFVDMRMPPGWDGLQTATELWKLDPSMQIVFCTAYSPYSWDEALENFERHDRLLVIKKPFDPIEVWQAACTLCAKWNFERHAHAKIARLEEQVGQRSASPS